MGVWFLSWQHARRERVQTIVLVMCAMIAFALPLLSSTLFEQYDRALRARAAETPLLLGPQGDDLDLTLSALYFRKNKLPTIPQKAWRTLADERRGIAIPLHTRFAARGHPIVGTAPEYYELRKLRAQSGELPLVLGECALGADLAEELGLGAGDHLFSDPIDLYDIAKPPSLKMQVVGTLAPTGGPDDRAVFVAVRTAWVLEGIFHGHDEPKELDPNLVIGESPDGSVDLSGAMIEYNEITADNVQSFHFHGDPDTLPLSSVLFLPATEKDGTILRTRYNARSEYQMVRPPAVIDELMGTVLRIKDLLDGLAIIIGATTALLTALVIVLGLRLRRREIRTFHHLGAGPRFVLRLYATEIGGILLLAAGLAALVTLGALAILPDLVRAL